MAKVRVKTLVEVELEVIVNEENARLAYIMLLESKRMWTKTAKDSVDVVYRGLEMTVDLIARSGSTVDNATEAAMKAAEFDMEFPVFERVDDDL